MLQLSETLFPVGLLTYSNFPLLVVGVHDIAKIVLQRTGHLFGSVYRGLTYNTNVL